MNNTETYLDDDEVSVVNPTLQDDVFLLDGKNAAQQYAETLQFKKYKEDRVSMAASKPICELKADGTLHWNFHWGQSQVMNCPKRFVIALAGRQGGKTEVGAPWLLQEIMARGPGLYMVVAPSFPLLQDSALPKFRHLFETMLGLGKYVGDPSPRFTFSKEGEKLIFGSAQEKPTIVRFCHAQNARSLEAKTALACWIDEGGQDDFTLQAWEAIEGRLTTTRGRCLITTTPYNLGFLKLTFFDPWMAEKKNHEHIEIIQFDSTLNPAFPREEFERLEKRMPGWRFRMFYKGEFAVPSGLVYSVIQDVEDRIRLPRTAPYWPLPDYFPRYGGIDFGGVNTCGVLAAQTTHEWNGLSAGTLILYRIYKPGFARRIHEHAADILAGEGFIDRWVGGARSEGQWRDEFWDEGVPIEEPPISDVNVGIQRVYNLLAAGKFCAFADLADFWDEIYSYRYETDPGTGEITAAQKIVNQNAYHCLSSDTQILCRHGNVAISDVRVGNEVMTRKGWKTVTRSQSVGIRETLKLVTSDGRTVVGSSDHLFFVKGVGWKKMDELRYHDTLVVCQNLNQGSLPESTIRSQEKRSFIATKFSTVTRMMKSTRLARTFTTRKGKPCIELCGKRVMAKFHGAITFITKTAMPTTMTYLTLSAWRGWNTLCSMQPSVAVCAPISNGLISTVPGQGHLNGTGRQKGENGTVGTEKLFKKGAARGPSQLTSATAAVTSLAPSSLGRSIAQTTVSLRPEEMVKLIERSESVNFVKSNSTLTDTGQLELAECRVQSVCDGEPLELFDISVADTPEFYANGILVHNCLDGVRYQCSIFSELANSQSLPRNTDFSTTTKEALTGMENRMRKSTNGRTFAVDPLHMETMATTRSGTLPSKMSRFMTPLIGR